MERTSKIKETNGEQEGSTKDFSPTLFSKEKEDLDKIDEMEEIYKNSLVNLDWNSIL